MDYFNKVEESAKFTWRNKKLWLLGFLAALGSGSSGFNFPSNYSSSSEAEVSSEVENFFEDSVNLVLVLVFGCIALIVALVVWYLSRAAAAGLIKAADVDDKGETPLGLRMAWKEGRRKAFSLMGLDLVLILLGLVLVIVAIPAFIIPPLICCLLTFAIPLMIMFSLTVYAAQRYIVLQDASIIESLSMGWNLTVKNLGEYLMAGLVNVLVSFLWGIVMLMLMAPFIALTVLAVVFAFTSPIGVVAVIVMAFVIILAIAAGAVINSAFSVYTHTYFTKVFNELLKS